MKMKQQTQIKKLNIIEREIKKLIQENEKLKAENKKLKKKVFKNTHSLK
jgi:cell division septum initiation protein DivIVA